MASVLISTKSVGSTIKLKVNGANKNWIIVHQGKPGTMYDESCNGTWVVMEDCITEMTYGSSQLYAPSSVHSYLNGTFFNSLEENIRNDAVRQVKIPYASAQTTVKTGTNGLSCKVFLLSGTEVGFTESWMNKEGAKLSYFTNNARRIAKYNGSNASWWLRSPYTNYSYYVCFVGTDGTASRNFYDRTSAVRPAMVLNSNLMVSDDGTVTTNQPPVITSTSGSSGVDLGNQGEPFTFSYTVTDPDGDTMTVTEKIDNEVKKTRADVTSGSTFNFEALASEDAFRPILNGKHTLTVEVTDSKATDTFTATFNKYITSVTITLKEPLSVAGDISVAVLSVTGNIPEDAVFTVKVTNNALDDEPVWQDVTAEVKAQENIVFENTEHTNNAAFNFEVHAERGSSGTAGYIDSVVGAFQ